MIAPAATPSIPDFGLVLFVGADQADLLALTGQLFGDTLVGRAPLLAAGRGPGEGLVQRIEERLRARELAIVDARLLSARDRQRLASIARRWHAPMTSIVLCLEGGNVSRLFAKLSQEGFKRVIALDVGRASTIGPPIIVPLDVDRRADTSAFDIIGDVHGCAAELEQLLCQLGYQVTWGASEGTRQVSVTPPEGRKAIFVGDLVDRGPNTPDVLRIAMRLVGDAAGYCVQGNHERKLLRALEGGDVTVRHGLAESLGQISCEPPSFAREVRSFLDNLPSHVWLDGGHLVVAHAGIKAEMIGRESRSVSHFTLFGDTTGEIDQLGLPVRREWAASYSGGTAIVYGHTPVRVPGWLNNTLCLDTGCVFGGALSAMRWPEREIVRKPADRVWWRRPIERE